MINLSNEKSNQKLPKHYVSIGKRYEKYGDVLGNLGRVVKELGPIDDKTSQLIQLAAAAAINLKVLFTVMQEGQLIPEHLEMRFTNQFYYLQVL